MSFPLGESFTIRSPAGLGPIRQVIVGREGHLLVFGVEADGSGNLRQPAAFVKFQGLKLGTTDVTLVGETNESTISVRVRPDLNFLEAVLARHFPETSLTLAEGGDKLLIVEGEVSSPAEIDPILTLLTRLVGQGNVINAIRVNGIMQVQLEVVFARVDRTELRKMGFNYLSTSKPWYSGSQIGNLINPPAVALRPPATGSNVFSPVGAGADAATGGALTSASNFFFGITKESGSFFGYLELMKDKGLVKVLANPTLVTISGRPAEFLSGGEQPFPTVGGLQTQGVEFKKFGTRLNFLPVVLGAGKIRLEMVPEVSTVNFGAAINVGGLTVPQIVTQKLHATVEMSDGETLILGGIIQTEKDARVSQVPVLGKLPIAGPLFRRVSDATRETELMVVVTPRLCGPLREAPTCFPGTETRNPTDRELYLKGLLEVPVGSGPKCDFHPSLGGDGPRLPVEDAERILVTDEALPPPQDLPPTPEQANPQQPKPEQPAPDRPASERPAPDRPAQGAAKRLRLRMQ